MSASTEDRIDLFLESKGKKPKTNYRSLIALKKLLNSPWGEEKHLQEMALGCFAELAEIDDEPSREFMKRLFKESSLIGSSVIKMYAPPGGFDMDTLPKQH